MKLQMRLTAGLDVKDITFIGGTVLTLKSRGSIYDAMDLPSFEEIKERKNVCKKLLDPASEYGSVSGKRLIEAIYGIRAMWCRIHRQIH